MSDRNAPPPAVRPAQVPSALSGVGRAADLPAGRHWFGTERGVLERNRQVVEASAAYLEARRRQSDAYTALFDARMRIARKIAELADLPNLIAEEQRAREHQRWSAEQGRQAAREQVAFDRQLAAARQAAALARVAETVVRAERNLDAARRVKDAQLDQWYAEAQARTNNAKAEFEDTVADLGQPDGSPPTPPPRDDAAVQKARDLAVLDDQIELERQRGNEAVAMALLNLRARLTAGGAP